MTGRTAVTRVAAVLALAAAACASFSEKNDPAAGEDGGVLDASVDRAADDARADDGGASDAAEAGDARFCDGVKGAAACEDFDIEGGIGMRGFTLGSGSVITQDEQPAFSQPFSGRALVAAFSSGAAKSSVLEKVLGAAPGYRLEARLQRKTNTDTNDLTMVVMTASAGSDVAVMRLIARANDSQMQFCRGGNCSSKSSDAKFDRWRAVVVSFDGASGRSSVSIDGVAYYVDGAATKPTGMSLQIGTIDAPTSTSERVVWLDDVVLTQL